MAMSEEEEMVSQRKGAAGGSQTDHGRETVVETDTESEMHLPPKKLREGSMMSGGGKTAIGVKKTKKRILEAQMSLLLRKRSQTLNCRGH